MPADRWRTRRSHSTRPPETGHYRRYLIEHRYLALLPRSLLDTLISYYPWLPILAIDAPIGIPFYFVGITLIGRGRIGERSRPSPGCLRRWLWRR